MYTLSEKDFRIEKDDPLEIVQAKIASNAWYFSRSISERRAKSLAKKFRCSVRLAYSKGFSFYTIEIGRKI